MYIDLSCYDRDETDESVRKAIFCAVDKVLNGISIHPYFIKDNKGFLSEGMILSSPIDFPHGVSDISVRSHATLAAIRKGANAIDLVANNSLLSNEKMGKFYDDIESIHKICVENNVTTRIMLEYRLYDPDKVVRICNGIRELGIEYIFPATATSVDSWDDNLAIAIEITRKANIKVITNGNIWKKQHYNFIKGTEVFGVRFQSYSSLENILA